MTFRTNALKVQAFAGALYGVQVGTTTMAQVNADITSGGGLANTLNSYYASSFGGVANATVAASVATNLGLTGDALASGTAYIAAQLNGAAAGARGAVISNILDLFAGLASDATFGAAATAWNAKVDAANAYTGAANVAIGSTVGQGSVFTLTTGVDGVNGGTNFTGGAGSDVFNAVVGTWTALDAIDGGAGNDILNVTDTGAISAPTGATVSNIETINAVTNSTVSLTTTTGFTGLTNLNTTSTGGATVVAAATTAVKVTNTDASTGAQAIAVTGGSTVNVTSSNNVLDTIDVGTTAIPSAGAVTITSNSATDSAASTQGAITVNGGTTVSVAQTAANTALTGAATTAGAVTVNGGALTTEVTVSDTAAATGFTATATIAGVAGRVNGAVTINDVNKGSATSAGKITTVTLNSFAAAAIDSSAITTVNLSGKGTSVDIGRGALSATPTANTIGVNVSGLTLSGALTDTEAASDDGFTTVNIASTTTASTVGSMDFADAKTVNVSGNAKFTSAGETLTSVTAINVTNTAGAAFGTAIGTGVTFTGGDGADSVLLSNAFTKSNAMGAGNDTVTYGGAASTTTGAKGFMDAGAGTDVIIMTDAQAASADDDSAFNAAFSNFETLRISNAIDEDSIDLDGINGATTVILAGAVTGTAGINNLASGGTVQMRVDGASTPVLTVGVRSALSGASDTLNLVLNKNGAFTAGKVIAASVETIAISNFDAPTAPTLGFDAKAGSMTLEATSATTITVSGNNGLNLTNTGNTKVTTFDASGVVANNTAATATLSATSDSSTELAVTFASANTTTTATVTITGGAGADTLTGNASKDTINGGAGADAINGGTGQDTLTGGSGADTFTFGDDDSVYNAIDVITDLSAADNIIYADATLAFSGAVTGTGTTATISSAGVATFTTIVGVAASTLVDKIKILDATLDVDGRAVLFAQDDVTYMYINNDTATSADLTGIVIQLAGVALPASPTTDGSATGLSGFGA